MKVGLFFLLILVDLRRGTGYDSKGFPEFWEKGLQIKEKKDLGI